MSRQEETITFYEASARIIGLEALIGNSEFLLAVEDAEARVEAITDAVKTSISDISRLGETLDAIRRREFICSLFVARDRAGHMNQVLERTKEVPSLVGKIKKKLRQCAFPNPHNPSDTRFLDPGYWPLKEVISGQPVWVVDMLLMMLNAYVVTQKRAAADIRKSRGVE